MIIINRPDIVRLYNMFTNGDMADLSTISEQTLSMFMEQLLDALRDVKNELWERNINGKQIEGRTHGISL